MLPISIALGSSVPRGCQEEQGEEEEEEEHLKKVSLDRGKKHEEEIKETLGCQICCLK